MADRGRRSSCEKAAQQAGLFYRWLSTAVDRGAEEACQRRHRIGNLSSPDEAHEARLALMARVLTGRDDAVRVVHGSAPHESVAGQVVGEVFRGLLEFLFLR